MLSRTAVKTSCSIIVVVIEHLLTPIVGLSLAPIEINKLRLLAAQTTRGSTEGIAMETSRIAISLP
jgi:hypothetical protein